MIGAPDEDGDKFSGEDDNSKGGAGAAYVFVRSGGRWFQRSYLKSTSPDTSEFFGESVAIDGDRIAIGAPGEDFFAENSAGRVYVFSRSGLDWEHESSFTSSNLEDSDDFGESVAIAGETIVVGAPDEDANGSGEGNNDASNSGAAYVFIKTGTFTWTQQAYLKASHPDVSDDFGESVAISGDTIVVGADREDSNGSDPANNDASGSGAAYVFVRDGIAWSLQAILKASNVEDGDKFGVSVGIDGDAVIIGADGEDGDGSDQGNNDEAGSGAVYLFDRSGATWLQSAYLKASTADGGDGFGESVGISGDTFVVGSPDEDSDGTSQDNDDALGSGATFVFLDNTVAVRKAQLLKQVAALKRKIRRFKKAGNKRKAGALNRKAKRLMRQYQAL